jgi:chromosome segregation ATPase
VLGQLQQELKKEQLSSREFASQVELSKRTLNELGVELEMSHRKDQDSSNRVSELESYVSKLRDNCDVTEQRLRSSREELAAKDGELRLTMLTLDTSEKQNQQLLAQVSSHRKIYPKIICLFVVYNLFLLL